MARERYRTVASNASVLFFTVADLSSVDATYQYSLGWFVRLYLASVKGAEPSGRPLSSSTTIEGGSSGMEEEGERLLPAAGRLEALRSHFTFALHSNVCRSLFEKDKVGQVFLLSVNLLRSGGKISDDEWRFFLLGGRGQEASHERPAPWLPQGPWNDLCCLDSVEGFSGLRRSFEILTEKWRAIYDSHQPHLERFPSEFGTSLGLFQKLLIVRCLRPDKVICATMDFISEVLGPKFTQPPSFDLEESFNDSSPLSPLIFVLSPGSDPVSGLLKFGEAKGFGSNRFACLSLGRGQGPIGASLIERASAEGTWVLLQNCHLAPSWMPSLERIVENLDPGKVHPDFRLWLTSHPCPDFPHLLLQNGVKMTCEPARGLRHKVATLLASGPVADPDFWERSVDRNRMEWKRMLFGLVCFHAVVQERRSFGPIGWNVHYEFNESDFGISLRRLQAAFQQCEVVQYESLLYMTAECDYGGRVTDHWDRRTLTTLLQRFYAPPGEDCSGSCGLLQALGLSGDLEYESLVEKVHDLPSTSDPGVFGLHENAATSRDTAEARQLFSSILLTQTSILTASSSSSAFSSSTSGSRGSFESAAVAASEILDKISALSLDVDRASRKYPTNREQSMNTVLIQEMVRFDSLLDAIKSSLTDVRRAIQGQVVMTPELEKVAQSITIGKIPEAWKRKSYPSLKPLGSYINDLVDRLKFMNDWLEDGPPTTYWISGFFFTQAFLTGIRQDHARRRGIAVDLITFDYEVMDGPVSDMVPDHGAYVRGLFIEGARWDGREKVLRESLPRVLYEEMPIVSAQGIVSSGYARQTWSITILIFPSLWKIWIKPCLGDDLARSQGVYSAPLYKTCERKGHLSTTGHSTNFVDVVFLPSDRLEEHWIERGVALLCQLDD